MLGANANKMFYIQVKSEAYKCYKISYQKRHANFSVSTKAMMHKLGSIQRWFLSQLAP